MKHDMHSVMQAVLAARAEGDRPLPVLTSNQCHALAQELNKGLPECEDKAFLTWANREYDVGEGYELNESNYDVVENRKGWMARAALERKP